MDYIKIGKIVNTHGIKGEIRILLDDILLLNKNTIEFLTYDDLIKTVFINNKKIYIGEYKEENLIMTYRHHKMYEMITLEGINDIDEVLKYKSKNCYVTSDAILTDEITTLMSLIGFNVLKNEENIGKIVDYQNNNGNIVFEIMYNDNYYIPINNHFIEKIDKENKIIYVTNVEGLIK